MRKKNNPLILEILNIYKVKDLIEKINQKIDNKKYIYELSKYVKDFPICEICGNPIYFDSMFLYIKNDKLFISTPTFEQKFKDNTFYISKCIDCIKDNFKEKMPSMQRYLFMIRYNWAKFVYNIPEEIHKEIKSEMCAITKNGLIKKYGEEDGLARWKKYCDKQSETNTFEYKQKKYGWTKEQFNKFNKSRACTIENFIDRHGEELGKKKWKEYVDKQKETKSWDYMVEKFGVDRALEINASKAVTLNKLIQKYGKMEGKKRWIMFCKTNEKFYSEISQDLFKKLDKKLMLKSYFGSKNGEWSLITEENKSYLLDYYIPSLKLCIEFDGDMWHANPSIYLPTDHPNPYSDLTAQEIWENDKKKQKYLESQGIRVVRIWESEYKSKDFDINKFIAERMGISIKA